MPAFSYRAVDPAGQPQRGMIEASSAAGARRLLRDRQLLPTAVEAAGPSSAPSRVARLFGPRIGARALATVTRQLATLIGSDVRIEEALRLVAQQADSAALGGVLLAIRGNVLEGQSFAAALGDQRSAFPEYYRASVAAGEQSGRLAEVLAHLAEFVESRHRNQQKVQLALLYPALLALISLGMMTLLLVYVVPDIVKVFVSRGAALPFLTRALIALSGGVARWGWLVALLLLLAGIAARRWLAIPANRLALDRRLATSRPFARFSRQHNAARFAGSLATLVQSGVPLVEALAAAAAVTPNRHIRAQALGVTTRVREGASLNAAMAEAAIFPSMLIAIVASGESSGKLGATLGRGATELERELDSLVTTLVALVEPAVLLLMGGLVMLMVLAILLPIINLNNIVAM